MNGRRSSAPGVAGATHGGDVREYRVESVRRRTRPPEVAREALQIPGSAFLATSAISGVASTIVVSHSSDRK